MAEAAGPASGPERQDGTVRLTVDFTARQSIVGWVASFGDGAELLEPEEIRKDILAFAEGIRKNYL